MMAVLNERWLSMGWRVMDRKDCEPMALIWIADLNRDGVPYSQYHELYHRAVELRARRYQQGLTCDDFSVEMMLACWPALRTELREREIAARRTLTPNAESVCRHCLGSGWRKMGDDRTAPVTRCDHRDGGT